MRRNQVIEATQGTAEEENCGRIFRREYRELPPAIGLLYPLVALNDMYAVHIPFGLACSAMATLPGCVAPSLQHIRTTLNDVIELRGLTLCTRNSLIARTLCEALDDPAPADRTMWLPIIEAILASIS